MECEYSYVCTELNTEFKCTRTAIPDCKYCNYHCISDYSDEELDEALNLFKNGNFSSLQKALDGMPEKYHLFCYSVTFK